MKMRCILVIDDQQDNLTSVKAVIKSRIPDCIVETALSAKEGIDIAKEKQPDTILLDIFMPIMDGFETCKILKNDPSTSHIPIIMITAIKSDARSRAKAMDIGADAFVSKPIEPIELSAQIKAMLRIKLAEDNLRKENIDLELLVDERSKEIKKQKEKLNQIVYGNVIATFVIDNNHKVTHWNKACELITNVKEKDIIGTNNHSIVFYNEYRPIMADIVIYNNKEELLNNYYPDKYHKSKLIDNAFVAEDFFPNFNKKGTWLYFTAVPLYDGEEIVGAIETLQDISLDKENEFRLKESEEKYRNLVERANDGICIVQDNVLKYANSCLAKIWGGTVREIINKKFTDFIYGENLRNIVSLYNDRISGKEVPSIYETPLKHKLGHKIHAELSAGIIQYEGKPADLIVIRDVTERKIAETEIKRLSTAIEQSPTIIVITDLEGKIEYTNPKFLELTGYTKKEIITNKPNILKAGCHSDEFYFEIWSTISSGNVWHGEFCNKNKAGEIYWESASISPIKDKKGIITNYVKVAEDITEKKRAEQIHIMLYNISNAVLRTENLNELLVIIQKELNTIIDASNFYVALYDNKDDTLSFPYHKDSQDMFKKVSAANTLTKYVIETKKPLLANQEIKNRFVEEGKLIHVGSLSKIWLGVPLKIDDVILGAFAVQSYDDENAYTENDLQMLDFVSEQISIYLHRKKAVDDLILALEKANESDRLKTAFLQNISHEIRTPMNGIFGFASLLKDPTLTGEEQQSYIDVIMTSGKRMLGTLKDLMDISMLETEQVKVNHEIVNINDELRILHNLFVGETNPKKLDLLISTPLPDNMINILTDKSKFLAILTNLIKNAIKYSNKGSIDFGYEIDNEFIKFHVKDCGIGIPQNKHEVIFNRFEQADIEDVKVHEGSGLGLSISKGYVELLGGEIWLESEVDIGSQFYFTIPYNSVQIKSNTKEIYKHKKPDSQKSQSIKILIAEDEIFAEEYLKIILSDICPDPFIARNGQDAVDICRDNPNIDLILMDIKMPIKSGYDAIKEIREFNQDTYIIAQTAYALAGDFEKAIAVGSNDYISKPINSEKLKEKIKIAFQ